MAAFKPKQVPQSTFVVFLFWGGSFALLYSDGTFDLFYTLAIAVIVSFALIAASIESSSKRQHIKKALDVRTWHGMWSSLADIPIHKHPLPVRRTIDPKILREHYPDEISQEIEVSLNEYVSKYSEKYPHYVNLFYALIRLLTAPEHLAYQASYHIDATGEIEADNPSRAHENRSLLKHCLLVYGLGAMGYASYCKAYTPDKPKRANDIQFKPNENDPLMGILTLAHDIGKLLTFKVSEEDGRIVVRKVLKKHDIYGARVIAMLAEFWDPAIPAPEREILLNVLACYHHPQELPYAPAYEDSTEKYVSDREVALLKYLITTDRRAGAVEGGMSVKDILASTEELVSVQDVTDTDDWVNLLIRFLATNNDINLSKGQRSIAFKSELNGRSLLIFDEKLFLKAFCDFIKKPEHAELNTQRAPHPVTSNVLEKLDTLSIVYRADKGEVFGRPANLCLYSVRFSTEESEEPFLVINSAFTLDITNWEPLERVKNMTNMKAVVKFGSCKFGGRGQRNDLLQDAINEEITGEATSTEVASISAFGNKSSTPKPAKKLNGSVLKGMIKAAISKKQIEVAKEFDLNGRQVKALIVANQWFADQKLDLEAIKDPAVLESASILEIKPSKQREETQIITIAI